MQVLNLKKKLNMIILVGFTAFSCKDYCSINYAENIQVELDGIKDRNLVNSVFVTQNSDTIRIDKSSNIYIGGGTGTSEDYVSLYFYMGEKMINGKILIYYKDKEFILENLTYETISCDPGTLKKINNYIEFRSFDFNGNRVNLNKASIQYNKGIIKL